MLKLQRILDNVHKMHPFYEMLCIIRIKFLYGEEIDATRFKEE